MPVIGQFFQAHSAGNPLCLSKGEKSHGNACICFTKNMAKAHFSFMPAFICAFLSLPHQSFDCIAGNDRPAALDSGKGRRRRQRFFISYGIGHFVNGILGDRLPVKKFLLLGLTGTAFCNLLIGFFPYYPVILVVWLVNGIFLSTLWGPVVRAAAIWYAPHERNIPAMLVSASSLGGYLLSWAGLGFVVEHTGWQGAFFFPGAVTIAFTVWFFLRMNDAPERMGFPNYERFAPKAAQPQDSAAQNITLWSFELGVFSCLFGAKNNPVLPISAKRDCLLFNAFHHTDSVSNAATLITQFWP